MKKFIKKVLCIILPLIIVFSASILIFQHLQREPSYYVLNGSTGNGKSAKNPAASVLDVIKTINEDGLTEDDTVKVYIMQRDDYDVYPENQEHFKTYWAKNGAKPENHTAKIIIQPYSYEKATELAYSNTLHENQVIHISGPTIFKNINVVGLAESGNNEIFLNGNDFVTERDVSFKPMTFNSVKTSGDSYSHCLNLAEIEKASNNTPINIELKNRINTQGSIFIGNNNDSTVTSTFNQDINITLNCQDYESHSTLSYPIVFSNSVILNKNLNIYAKRAEEIKFTASENADISVNGGVQFIYNDATTVNTPIDALGVFTNETKIWSICLEPSAENCIEPSEVPGTYNVIKDITLSATDQNGNSVDSTSSGKLILNEGNWTVKKKNSIHYGDANSDGVLDSKDIKATEVLIAKSKYYPPADINSDKVIDDYDLSLLREHLNGTKSIKWESRDIELCETLDLSGAADKEAKELKDKILNSESTVPLQGTTYYFSDKGDPFNEGLSPEEPLSIDSIDILYLLPGDAVLFERGSVFRLKKPITPQDGIYYGAYGKGEKPQFLGSFKDYADPTIWVSDNAVLWQTKLPEGAGGGNVVFNNGEAVATRKLTLEEVKKDGDYFFDSESSILYLYLNQYNPGYYFDNIEIANIQFIFQATGSSADVLISDMYFENLCLKYPSKHAFSLNFGENLTVKNCEIAWVGGDWYGNKGTRLGNAVEFWAVAKGNTVSNNYIHQIYDAAVTFQGTSDNNYTDITIENNLIEYCSMNFEFWASEDGVQSATSNSPNANFHNISISDNIFRFGGYGYSNLYRSDRTDQAYILTWYYNYDKNQFKNFNITNNIFDIANSYFFYGPNAIKNINICNNTYYQKSGSINKSIRDHHFYSENQSSFELAIKSIDRNPKSIKWIS